MSLSTRLALSLALLPASLLTLMPTAATAQMVVGPAEVIDGDTLDVGGERIRLFGIDAPESQQSCTRGGANWACGSESTQQLANLIAGRAVRCEGRDVDAYGRTVAVCRVGGMDVGQAMVQTGLAVAFRRYSTDYVSDEDHARGARRGLWASSFTTPSEWRAERRGDAAAGVTVARGGAAVRSAPSRTTPLPAVRDTSGGRCVIKGNINRRGEHIYHMPGMPYYTVTNPERMFCSEAEAQAAGFRRAIVR